MVPLSFLGNRVRLTAYTVTIIVGGVSATVFFIVVLYAQDVVGYSPLQSAPSRGCRHRSVVGIMLAMRIIRRFGPRRAMTGGMLIAGVGVFLLSMIRVQGSFVLDLLPATVLIAIGFGMANPACNTPPCTTPPRATPPRPYCSVEPCVNNATTATRQG